MISPFPYGAPLQTTQMQLMSLTADWYCWSIQEPIRLRAVSLCRYAPQPTFAAAGSLFSVAMEALLVGHEDWVFSAAWQPQQPVADNADSVAPCLLTASMDRTMMLWRPEASAGLQSCLCQSFTTSKMQMNLHTCHMLLLYQRCH